MPRKAFLPVPRAGRRYPLQALSVLVFVAACFLLAGCSLSLTPLAKHTAAFSSATNRVIDSSTSAYRAAIDLHDQEQASAGVLRVLQGDTWDPHDTKPLISPLGMAARLKVLDALKSYAQSLSDLTSSLNSKEIDTDAASTGSGLKELSDEIVSEGGAAKFGFSLDAQGAKIVSTAAKAIGDFLVEKKIKGSVLTVTREMDPHIDALCGLLGDDVDTLRKQSKKDYEDLLRQQMLYYRENEKQLAVSERRDEVQKLPAILKNEQSTDALLSGLQVAIRRLALTHHALAAAALGKDTEALNARIADLAAAGEDLGKFYGSLPSK
jgi:hypothetical protein